MLETLQPYERLKEDRADLGLTQQQMADEMGITLRAYQDLEAGKSAYRKIHRLAIERISLKLAVEQKDVTRAGIGIVDELKAYAELLRQRGY